MRGVCAWCGKDLQPAHPADPSLITHGICQACLLDLRLAETVRLLGPGGGPYTLFLPPQRDDLLLRIQREAPPGCAFIVHPDRRRGERRARRVAPPADRRSGRDRRAANF